MAAKAFAISAPVPIPAQADPNFLPGLWSNTVELEALAKRRCVYIESKKHFGTGTVLETGLVLTTKHVLKGCRGNVWVNGNPAQIFYRSRRHDLAALTVPTSKFQPLKIVKKVHIDDMVFYFGNTYDGLRSYRYAGRINHVEKDRFTIACVSDKGGCGGGVWMLCGDRLDFVGISCTEEDLNTTVVISGGIVQRFATTVKNRLNRVVSIETYRQLRLV